MLSWCVYSHLKRHSFIKGCRYIELESDWGSEESASTSEEEEDEEEESSESSPDSSDAASRSSSSSSSSDSLPPREPIEMENEDSDEESRITKQHKENKAKLSRLVAEDDSDDDSDSMGEKKGNTPATAHEITVPTVVLPSITEIGPDEPMELIGEVLNVVDSVVVVKSSQNGMQRVLDTESLLVFEDRKVLGLVSGFVGVSFSMPVLTQ